MQKSKVTLILAIIALCCFLFAGTALAAEPNVLIVKADGESFAYTGCTNEYTLEISTVQSFPADCLNDVDGATISIRFKDSGAATSPNPNFLITDDMSLPVSFYITDALGQNGEWFFAQPTVEVNTPGEAVLFLESLHIPNAADRYVKKVFIGDDRQYLEVQNPCKAQLYCVEVEIETICNTYTLQKGFKVKSAPAAINVDKIFPRSQTNLPCIEALSITGTLKDCGQGWWTDENWPVKVTIGGTTVYGTADGNGNFDIDFLHPVGPGNHTVYVEAEDLPCGQGVVTSKTFYIDFNLATEIEVAVEDADGVGGQLRYNKCNEVTIYLKDVCGNPAVASYTEGVNVYFSAYVPGNPPKVAGHFYSECPDDSCKGYPNNRDEGQINFVTFAPGETVKTVYVIPLVEGDITFKATAIVGGKNIDNAVYPVFESIAPKNVDLEIVPLVTDENGNPKAGWPLSAAVRLDYTASENYDVTFTLNGGTLEFVDENCEFLTGVGFDMSGDDEGVYPYCHKKWYFLLYPSSELRGDATIEVTVHGVGTASAVVGEFVDPVEMTRTLLPDAWQSFSTPKFLAAEDKSMPLYATFEEFLPFDPTVFGNLYILGFRNGTWELKDPDDKVRPLEGYFVRTPQQKDAGREAYTLEYVFARALTPADAAPYSHDLYDTEDQCIIPEGSGFGWNTVGVAVDAKIATIDPVNLQSDTVNHAFGSLLKGNDSYLLWNPGSKIANVNNMNKDFTAISLSDRAFGSYFTDPSAPVYNGNVYWIYSSCDNSEHKPYSANIGLDMIEWIGANDVEYNNNIY